MKRTSRLVGEAGDTKITIAVSVESISSLTKSEVVEMVDYLTSEAMRAVSTTLYRPVPLNRQRVK